MVASKQNGGPVDSFSRRPPDRTFLEKIRYFIWDPEEKAFLGRTAKRWGIIGLIYLCTYVGLIIFFSICMWGLLSAMDERVPYYRLADSIIGNNPGMGHRPLILELGALIQYNTSDMVQLQRYVDNIEEFLAPYKNRSLLANGGENQRDCGATMPPRGEVCSFNVTSLGPCSEENMYGYTEGKPCVIIKLNKIYYWYPEFYEEFPPDMPDDILGYINSTSTAQERRKVWVSCAGEKDEDQAAIGPIVYWPNPGLSEIYFPYDNTPGYLSPIVAVQFMELKVNQLINIRCRAWARNIQYSKSLKERLGSTHFEIQLG